MKPSMSVDFGKELVVVPMWVTAEFDSKLTARLDVVKAVLPRTDVPASVKRSEAESTV